MRNRTRIATLASIAAVGLALVGCSGSSNADGNAFPEGPIELIVPFSAGGASDVQARAFAQAYEQANGDSIMVVNRPGGGTSIGTMEVAQAEPDGYTLLHSTASTFISLPLMEEVGFEVEDFESIISYGDLPTIVVVNSNTGWESLDDIDMSSELSIATTAPGNVLHLPVANFIEDAGGTSRYLPFDSSGETIEAVISGSADIVGLDPGLALPRIEAGEVTPVAVASTERLEELPDVPTFGELGYERSHDKYSRSAISVPAGTPDEIKQTLQEGAEKAFETETWKNYVDSTHIQEPAYEAEAFLEEWVPAETQWTLDSLETAGITPLEQ